MSFKKRQILKGAEGVSPLETVHSTAKSFIQTKFSWNTLQEGAFSAQCKPETDGIQTQGIGLSHERR